MRPTWTFGSAGEILFGDGAVGELVSWLGKRGYHRLLVITDRTLQGAGIVERVTHPLAAIGCAVEVFHEGAAEPSIEIAEQAAEAGRGFEPEVILGVGGGSNLDLAKITAVLLSHGGAPRDYFGFNRVPGQILPLVAVPTTAGTGSEVSHAAVLTDPDAGVKVSSLSRHLRPALALVDPELTWTCPPRVTADSGLDALTHAVEAYTATTFRQFENSPGERPYTGKAPLADLLAERAIQLVAAHLPTAYAEPENREARHGMALAALLAGLAFSNAGVALVHALEYPLGAALHVSHGAGNAMLLPHVMRYNLADRLQEFAQIAAWLGEPVVGEPLERAAARAPLAVERLNQRLGIPKGIRELGGSRDQLIEFAEKSFGITRLMEMNARRPASAEELRGILEAAFDPAD